MDVPKQLGNLRDIKEREKKAFDKAAQWHDTLETAYEYYLPQRNLFNEEETGQKKMDRIFDSTALEAIQAGASKLQESIAPIWARWAKFEPSTQVEELLKSGEYDVSDEEIRDNLEKQAATVFDVINRSNFGTQFYEMCLDLLIGTGTLKADEVDDDEMPVIFASTPQKGIAFEEGATGTIENHYRRFKKKYRHLTQTWKGFTPSSEVQQKIYESPDNECDVREAVIFDPQAKIYYGLVWVHGEDSVSWVAEFEDSSPWITGRYSKTAGEVRGRGPALQSLPDVKSLNKVKEFVLQKAALDLSGMFMATDDGVTNPYSITISPGVIIPVGSNNSANPSIQRLDTGSDLNLAQFEILELQNAIKRSLFADLREPSDAVVSATQYAMETRELAQRIGSAFGRLQTEVLIPVLKRVVYILTRRGMIQPLKLNGVDITVKFTSPLARTQDTEDLTAVQQAIEFTMATAGEEKAMMAFKLEDIGQWAGKRTGMPAELIRSDAEKQQIIQAGAQARQAEMEQGQPQQPQQPVQQGQTVQ
jgi:hypothetical protein